MGPPPTNLIPLEIPSSHEDGAPEILRPLPSSFFSSPSSRTHSFHLSPLPPPLPYLPFLFSSSSFLFFSPTTTLLFPSFLPPSSFLPDRHAQNQQRCYFFTIEMRGKEGYERNLTTRDYLRVQRGTG